MSANNRITGASRRQHGFQRNRNVQVQRGYYNSPANEMNRLEQIGSLAGNQTTNISRLQNSGTSDDFQHNHDDRKRSFLIAKETGQISNARVRNTHTTTDKAMTIPMILNQSSDQIIHLKQNKQLRIGKFNSKQALNRKQTATFDTTRRHDDLVAKTSYRSDNNYTRKYNNIINNQWTSSKNSYSKVSFAKRMMQLDKEPGVLLRSLLEEKNYLIKELQNYAVDIDHNRDIICMLARACQCKDNNSNISELLSIINEKSDFLGGRLFFFVTDCLARPNASIVELNWSLAIIRTFMIYLPTSSVQSVSKLLTQFNNISEMHQADDSLIKLSNEINILRKMHTGIVKAMGSTLLNGRNHVVLDREMWIKASNNFREIPVLPTEFLLKHGETLFVRQNRIYGGYNDVEHYLDVQFRLLHEDFLRPLREGIQAYCSFLAGFTNNELNNNNSRSFRHDDLRVYHRVQIKNIEGNNDGVTWLIEIDAQKKTKTSWKNKLLPGNLVCFSSDNFETIYFGTIANRSNEESSQLGLLSVHFDRQNMFRLTLAPFKPMTMIEPSSSYFVPYKSVLEGLQEMQEIPFENYLISVKLDMIDAPAYLRGQNILPAEKCMEIESNTDFFEDYSSKLYYDFSSNMLLNRNYSNESQSYDENRKLIAPSEGVINATSREGIKYNFGHFFSPVVKMVSNSWSQQVMRRIKEEKIMVDVLQIDSWPTADKLNLDDSQYSALQNAVTKKLSVIQGPPGTGKTFIGLKFVQLLLHNKSAWQIEDNCDRRKSPILIVCYTNHALDQFLEGIINMNGQDTKLIRVGSQSKNVSLNEYLLFKKRKPFCKPSVETLNKMKSRLKQEYHKLNKNGTIFDYNALKAVISPEQKRSLLSWSPKHECCIIGHWLSMDDEKGFANLCKKAQIASQELNVKQKTNVRINKNQEKLTDEYLSEKIQWELTKEYQNEEIQCEVTDAYDNEETCREPGNEDMGEGSDLVNEKLTKKKGKKRCENEIRLRELENDLNINDIMTDEEETLVDDVWKLVQRDRLRLYKFWVRELFCAQSVTLRDYYDRYEEEVNRYKAARNDADIQALQNADIIGMTTTRAAYYRHVLQQVRPKIIIVEEAAEILEAHVITVMTPFTEHLVLIGDHQQLRPKVTVNQLGTKYNLEISLFERLVESGISFVRLHIQHRMRPEIAALICPLIYQDLENSDSVKHYDHVRGMKEDVFFYNHNEPEGVDSGTKSYHNEFEAVFIILFYCYLLQQGYEETQITILTPYIGQMFCLQRKFAEKLDGHTPKNIKVVDNYQGEENDIIIISLVRSNESKNIGFLNLPNRACVLLSRAKRGMYLIGNAEHFKKSSDLWNSIINMLERQKRVEKFLPLVCQHHPDMPAKFIHHYNDFEMLGGICNQYCGFQRPCGHKCILKCHNRDREHKVIKCPELCNRLCRDGLHACQKSCGEICGDCKEQVERKFEKCGHTQFMYCHKDPKYVECVSSCEQTCEFGHPCVKKCYEKCNPCMTLTEKVLPDCSHVEKIPCYVMPDHSLCQHSCEKKCEQGHNCIKRCGEECGPCLVVVEKIIPGCQHVKKVVCSTPLDVVQCHFLCDKTLPQCGHIQKIFCHENPIDATCQHPCEKKCENGHQCKGLCSAVCPPCEEKMEKIVPTCGHEQYVSCHKQPENIRCIHSCENQCPNGHNCSSLCYEIPCPPCNVLVYKTIPSCGHIQKAPCHIEVDNLKCQESCERLICSSGHKCRGQCSEPCKPCMVIVTKTLAICGHTCELPCSMPPDEYKCQVSCERFCDQGHKCVKICHETCGDCPVNVVKRLPQCGHDQEVPCSMKAENVMCRQRCQIKLACGHQCNKKCGDPEHTKPSECISEVKKSLKCGHKAETLCRIDVSEVNCRKIVFVKFECGHAHSSRCHESKEIICNKLEMRLLTCGHTAEVQCSMVRSYLCDEKVTKTLSCGHEIETLCSESEENLKCRTLVKVKVCKKNHENIIPCYRVREAASKPCTKSVTVDCKLNKKHAFAVKCSRSSDSNIPCPCKCKTPKLCGHECDGFCRDCSDNAAHLMCIQTSKVNLLCCHSSWTYCFGFTVPCKE